uniref:J domain-containing protein n=1 Tax=Globodera rostochiensis TaxID=31243 RepID=A0A914HV03_GLORO
MDFDPFEALRLEPCTDKAKIKKKYRQLAKKFHPDKTGSDDSEFKRINKAYKSLLEMDDANTLAEYVVGTFYVLAQCVGGKSFFGGPAKVGLIAAQNGHIKVARRLLKRGADPRRTGTVMVDGQMINKVTPLRIAAFKGHLKMCKLLVAHGTANDIDQDTKRMLICATCYGGGHLGIVKHFGTGINYCERLALTAASFHGRGDIVRHLLSEGKASAGQSSDKSNSSSSSSSSWSWREFFDFLAESFREMPNFAELIKECIQIWSHIGGVLSAIFSFIFGPAWVFIGAVLIFAVGSLFIYDLKTIVSTYILLAFIAVFVKFGFDDIDDSG